MHPRGHISHVHSTASKYPFYSCRNNAVGTQNVNQTTESFTWASLSSSAAKAKENLLALWTWIRWIEKGLLPILKLRSPYKEKSRTSLTKQVHRSGTLFLYADGTGNMSNLKKHSHFWTNTKKLFQTVRGGVGPFFMDLSTTLFPRKCGGGCVHWAIFQWQYLHKYSRGFFATEHSSQSTVK